MSQQASPDGPVEQSRRLRLVAKARLEAARRSVLAVQASYGSLLKRGTEPERWITSPSGSNAVDNALVEDLFHEFLETQPGIHWLREGE